MNYDLIFNRSDAPREFRIYWNVPSFQCKVHQLPEINVTKEFGIRQNADDAFR